MPRYDNTGENVALWKKLCNVLGFVIFLNVILSNCLKNDDTVDSSKTTSHHLLSTRRMMINKVKQFLKIKIFYR